MTSYKDQESPDRNGVPPGAAPGVELTPAARRALEEAAARRAAVGAGDGTTPTGIGKPAETGGPAGPEPTRYSDWERKGRAVDF